MNKRMPHRNVLRLLLTLGFVLAAGLMFKPSAAANGYDLEWSGIDNGPASAGSGGVYTLTGSMGQPASGDATGGEYSLVGGTPTAVTLAILRAISQPPLWMMLWQALVGWFKTLVMMFP